MTRVLPAVYYEPLAHVMPTVAALLSGPPVKKLLFMSKPPVIDALRPEWARRLSGTGAAITQAVPSMLEVLPAGVNKGVALQSLVPSLGFTMDQVMAVGDGLNDLEARGRIASYGTHINRPSALVPNVSCR